MSLLLPAALLVLGCAAFGYAAWRDPEFKGSGLAAVLYVVVFGGPLACVAVGAWDMVRTGQWYSISIDRTLKFFEGLGLDLGLLREPASSPRLQALHLMYLDSALGWTLLVVPGTLIGFWHLLANRAPAKKK